jgi:membrane protein implicated in regulation of membrane protease activity
MSAFIKSHQLRLLAIVSCPVLAIVGAIFATIGAFADLPFIGRLGATAFSFAMILLLPLGIACAFLSWRMARTKSEVVSDSQDTETGGAMH